MERVTISLEEGLLAEFDGYMHRKGYENRSEAIRDLLRERLEADRVDKGEARHAVGCLSYVYNHYQRELARRLTRSQHDHHDLMLSTLHVHLDHENCLEVVLLQGETAAVRQFSEATIAETGVRHGYLHLVAADLERSHHDHGHAVEDHRHDDDREPHVHLKPKT
ncbi:nickel-responsive transcriptional regulator NikR [Telmatospirillum sp.]|uniref:nickel-responsive transcriptional regulator NikR n=1 Tax=Telmatospirillum sp. TaxID=2079197 RepID=UPI0028430316|nr:nickel-responsive transcriptional regulator NikR [Telmatospirillum sp.]MDR3440929.1 nickel-responsive transcriptional regulator NikR [Telmatospirillum sp.]